MSFNINPATGRSEQGLAGVVKPKTTHFFRTPQITYASIHYYQIHMPSVISLAIDQVWVRQSVLLSPLVSLLCLRQNLDLFYFWSYRKLANTCCYWCWWLFERKGSVEHFLYKYEWESFHLNAQQSSIHSVNGSMT